MEKFPIFGPAALTLVLALTLSALASHAAPPAILKPGSASPLARGAKDLGPAPASEMHRIVVGLALRDRDALEAFLVELQDPASPRYHQFLTQDEFNALYAPTEEEEQAVVAHLVGNGFRITDRAPNRLLVGATGSVGAIERAFGVRIHAVRYNGAAHFATFDEPSVPASLARVVVGVIGLDDLSEMRPRLRASGPVAAPNASLGSNCCSFSPNDLGAFYDNNTGFDGAGQTLVIAGAYAWKDSDNTAFNNQWGLPQLPPGSGQVCTASHPPHQGCSFNNQNSIEIALDVEYAHGTSPGAIVLNYMAASTLFADFTTAYNQIVTDNPGHVVSTSWGACEAGTSTSTQTTDDNIFMNANAIGQSWFAASGDDGSRDCNNLLTVDHPANSPHVIGVGGTTPTCSGGMTSGNPACAGYGSEVGWSGSGGGISNLFLRPSWQTGCGVLAGAKRLVPDVSLESSPMPGNYVIENGTWYAVYGTSGAAPQWAGFWAQMNQKLGGSGLGNPGSALYALCGTDAFHDVVTGSNGDYGAGAGYDMVTGLGTPDAMKLISPQSPENIPALSLSRGAALALVLVVAGAFMLRRRRAISRR